MNRYLASGLGVSLGLLASASRADDIAWHAPRDRAAQPAPVPVAVLAAPVAVTPAIAPPRANAEVAIASDVTWVRARGQAGDPVPAITGTPNLPVPTPVAPVPVPDSNVTMVPTPAPSSTAIVMDGQSSWLPGEDPWAMAGAATSGRAPRTQVWAEYLFWWNKQGTGPALLTTSPPNGVNGVPGAVPGSRVLLSAGDLTDNYRDGVRVGSMYWLDDCASYGFDSRTFYTWNRTNTFEANSNQFPNGLFRPFFIANPVVAGGPPVGEFREVVTAPGSTSGRFIAENQTQFWGAESNWRDNLLCRAGCNWTLRADLLVGFRYLNLEETMTLTEDVVRTAPSTMFPDEGTGTRIVNRESFATQNNFYGGQIGTIVDYRRNKLSAELRATVAIGTTEERVDINGAQTRFLQPSGGVLVLPGGLLALPSNIGSYRHDSFSVVPEVGLNVGYQMTDHFKAFVGYNFLYWSNVVRPGDQIDRVIDVNNIPRFVNVPPGTIPAVFPPRPAAQISETDFWAQGITLGVEYRW
jgi:hypothetical protein